MADITLRDYLAKLDSLLKSGAASEVIHHCRHILQYFPKNADTYRFLGRALVENKSWREADEVLRRLLSVYPDDFYAHIGLSEVSMAEKRPDDAIWFLERAFEQEPNNEVILDELRELYRKHRRVEHAKVQLTAGAVAQQYVRNGLFAQAVTTLQQALANAPDRIDLKLLLARTYWNAGQRIEGAETAVSVLQALPDCLEANRILAELWLGESRPSDAQRYIGNIQSVDPYLALELAKGQAVPDEAYKLEELDYRRVAEREIVNRSPDWLQAVDQAAEASSSSDDSADWMGSLRSRGTEEEELPTFDNASFSSQAPDDWFTELGDTDNAAAPEVPPPVTGRKRTGLTGLLSAIDVPEAEPIPEPEPIEDMLAGLPEIEDAPAGDSLDDLFKDAVFSPEDATPKPTHQTGEMREVDPLAWAKESGIDVSDKPLVEDNLDLFGADDDNLALQGAGEVDPLAWLKGSGDEDIISETDAPKAWSATAQFEAPARANTDDDPMAWLSETDIELKPSSAAPSSTGKKVDSDDPLDWLADESLLDEALNLEALTESPTDTSEQRVSNDIPATAEKPDRQDEMADDKDNAFDWMNEDSPKADSGDDEFTWLGETPTSSKEDLPDLFADLGGNDDAQPAADALDWMSELDDAGQQSDAGTDDVPSWLTEMKPAEAQAASTPTASDDSEFEWMSQAVTPEEEDLLAEPAGDTPDWLADLQPDEPQAAQPVAQSSPDDSEFEWMSQAVTPEEEDLLAEPIDDTPDWLADLQPDEPKTAQPVAQSSPDEGEFEWMSQVTEEEEPVAQADDLSAEPAGDTPDWLAEMQPAAEAEAEPAASAADDEFSWMTQATEEEEPAAQADDLSAEPAGEMPDWLSEMQPAAEAKAEPVASAADSEFEWMSQATEEEEPAAQADDLSAEIAGEMPDWLSEMQPAAGAEAEPAASAADDEFAWMGDAISEEDALEEEPVAQADDLSAEPAGEMPDWLSEMQPAAEEEAEPVASAADSGFEWMSQAAEEEEPVAQADDLSAEMAGEMPDWLSEMQPAAEEAAEPVASATDSGFEWMSQTAEEEPVAQADDLSAEPAGEMPDWLSEMQPAAEAKAEPVTSAADSGFDWGSDNGEQARQASVEEPDWIQTLQTSENAAVSAEATSDMDNEVVEPRGAVPEWLAALQQAEAAPPVMEEAPIPWDSELEAAEEQEEEPAVADEMPDWLQEVKSSRAEAPAPVEEAEASSEYEWIDDINTPETQPETAAVQELSFDDDFDLLSAEDADTTEAEPAVVSQAVNQATNAPDWLNAMVPGLDVDYDAPEDEQIEQEFLPGSENRVVPIFQGASQPARNREFQWLTDIVDEETQQMKAIPAKSQRGRFTFSQLPAWLRKPKEKQEQPSPQATGEDDDWSDVDLPPWLQ